MAFAFDTLGYAKKLGDARVPQCAASLRAPMDRPALRMTVRLGGMLAAAVVVLATLKRLS